jgi:hypothetical protein
MDKLIIKHLPKDREKLLLSRGVPYADLMHGLVNFDILSNLVKYETEIPGLQSKTVSVSKQIRAIESIVENPIRARYAVCINSFPSDLFAKYLAIHVFNLAITSWQKRHKPGRTMPIWHRVYGGYYDPLRDKQTDEIPSLLVIANVNDDSTPVKIEKVRDLLERYSNVPRIVVTSSKDPITFFATKLHFPINAGINIGPSNRIKEL